LTSLAPLGFGGLCGHDLGDEMSPLGLRDANPLGIRLLQALLRRLG
jgi:hypothetical protein